MIPGVFCLWTWNIHNNTQPECIPFGHECKCGAVTDLRLLLHLDGKMFSFRSILLSKNNIAPNSCSSKGSFHSFSVFHLRHCFTSESCCSFVTSANLLLLALFALLYFFMPFWLQILCIRFFYDSVFFSPSLFHHILLFAASVSCACVYRNTFTNWI